MTILKISEHNIQASFVDSILWLYRNDRTFIPALFFAVPNGAYLGGKSPAVFMKLKREGFRNGVADMLYLQRRGSYAFLALELKTEERRRQKGGGLSSEQVEFLKAVNAGGGFPAVCYGVEDALEAFSNYMRYPAGMSIPSSRLFV